MMAQSDNDFDTSGLKHLDVDDHKNDMQLFDNVFKKMGGDVINQKPELSALNLNESEFNMPEDSRFNDIIEVSNFAKPSEIGRFLDGTDDANEQELVRRFRKAAPENKPLFDKHRKQSDFLAPTAGKKDDDIFQEPQNFPDLDTSGIAVEAPHHFDKDFADGDNSFVGFQDRNSFEAEDNALEAGQSPFDQIQVKVPITPQVSKAKSKFVFPGEAPPASKVTPIKKPVERAESFGQFDEEVKLTEMDKLMSVEAKVSVILPNEQQIKNRPKTSKDIPELSQSNAQTNLLCK